MWGYIKLGCGKIKAKAVEKGWDQKMEQCYAPIKTKVVTCCKSLKEKILSKWTVFKPYVAGKYTACTTKLGEWYVKMKTTIKSNGGDSCMEKVREVMKTPFCVKAYDITSKVMEKGGCACVWSLIRHSCTLTKWKSFGNGAVKDVKKFAADTSQPIPQEEEGDANRHCEDTARVHPRQPLAVWILCGC